MDNQQPKVSGEEQGWLAGFFDGEGTVCLTIRLNKQGGPKIQPQALMGSTDTAALDKAHDILTRAGIGHHIEWWQPRGKAKNGNAYRKAWTIRMAGMKRCKAFLDWILPCLATKRERALVAHEYIALRFRHDAPNAFVTDEEWALALKMKELNQRTVGDLSAVKVTTERSIPSHEVMSANGRKGATARWGNRN